MKHAWLGLAAVAAAGCGAGDAPSATAKTGATPAPGVAAPAPAPGAPVMEAAAFLDAPTKTAGRVSIHGAVYSVDGKAARFLLIDMAEAGCIGGDC